jgi:hypothetical protein
MIENARVHAAERLLALEVRSGRIGFVVFEGPTRLLDWGVRSCSHPTRRLQDVVAKRVRSLMFRYKPFAVVMRCENSFSSRTAKRLRISVGAIRREANRCGVKLRLLKTQPRERFFVQLRCDTKHQVAQLIAELFEELSWKVPPKRKPWHSESYNTVIFDAAATGLVAFAEEFNPDAVRELIATTESFRRPPGGVAR